MSDLKPKGVEIELDGQKLYMLFTLNVMEAATDRYGKIDDLMQRIGAGVSDLKWFATQMLNEWIAIWNDEHPDNPKPLLTEAKLGRMVVGLPEMNKLGVLVREAIIQGLPKDAVEVVLNAEDDLKNLMTAREKTETDTVM